MWIAVLLSLCVWSLLPSYDSAYDLKIYQNALVSLRGGHDPYLDAIYLQRAFHATLAQHPDAIPPYSYVYSPITLPLMRWVARFPDLLSACVYWVVYAVCVLATIRVSMLAMKGSELRVFRVLAPVSIFFPGLLHHDTILSGNVAFVLYGLALGTAVLGWRRGTWAPFYVTVVLASCFKAPMLTLLAIPVFSARRQWLPAGLSAAAGVALFLGQARVWPTLFQHYLEAVDLQFRFNRDFSSSPAGVVANLLYAVLPYRVSSLLAYMAYAVPIACILFWFSRQYLDGRLRREEWQPVLLVGTILLNPRIMEYDAAPIALSMAVILWRLFARGNSYRTTLWKCGLVFVVLNVLAEVSWKPTECVALLGMFVAGSAMLWARVREQEREDEREMDSEFEGASVASPVFSA